MKKQERINYILNHERYHIMNSWNKLTGPSKNIKVYKYFCNEQLDKAYELLNCQDAMDYFYESINWLIDDFEENNQGYTIIQNGRSGGYFVLRNKSNNRSVFNYDKEDLKELSVDEVKEIYNTLKSFDQFCNNAINIFKEMIVKGDITEEKQTIIKKIKVFNI